MVHPVLLQHWVATSSPGGGCVVVDRVVGGGRTEKARVFMTYPRAQPLRRTRHCDVIRLFPSSTFLPPATVPEPNFLPPAATSRLAFTMSSSKGQEGSAVPTKQKGSWSSFLKVCLQRMTGGLAAGHAWCAVHMANTPAVYSIL